MKYYWILDFGHGGVDKNGVYKTKDKKQYHFTQEKISIYEGQINRLIGHKLAAMLKKHGICYKILTPGIEDHSLTNRVEAVNKFHDKHKNAILVSLHSNAASVSIRGEGSKATGYEIFTSKGETKSDVIAECFLKTYKKLFGNKLAMRTDITDGDLDKEANFKVLKETSCPAILVENLFYDNLKEAKYLLSEKGQKTIANALCTSILNFESGKW